MIGRVWAATVANLRMLARDRTALFFSLMLPILFMVIFGLIFGNTGNMKLDVGVAGSGPMAQALERTPALSAHVGTAQEVAQRVRDGHYQGAVVVEGRRATLYFSNTYPAQAAMLRGVVQGVADAVNLAAANRPRMVEVEPVSVDSSSLRYIDFLVPGLLGLNLMGTGMWGLGYAVVDARKKKLMKRLLASPMRKSHYLLSFIAARLTMLGPEVVLLIGFGMVAFGVPMRGSVVSFLLLAVIGAMCFAGIGLLTASRARTTETANGLMNLIMMPMWILSGVFFSSANFPAAMQPVIKALPLTALNDALRAVMLDGASLASVAGPAAICVTWGVVSFAVALRIFRWL